MPNKEVQHTLQAHLTPIHIKPVAARIPFLQQLEEQSHNRVKEDSLDAHAMIQTWTTAHFGSIAPMVLALAGPRPAAIGRTV